MRKLHIYNLFLFLLFAVQTAYAQKPGKLFIIGGGDRSKALLEDLVKTAELRSDDYIVVLPMATSVPEESIAYISEQLSEFTNKKIVSFNFDKEQANTKKSWIDSVQNARLIYITGGDQNKFMSVVRESKLYDAMHFAYKNGATISGTSAGAAVMSEIMITGTQIQDPKSDGFREVKANNVEVASGMGFLKNVIVDQHFIMRSRYNRLLSALHDHDNKMAVGIDEGTAMVVNGKNARVSGDSQVLVIYGPKNNRASDKGKVSFQKANFSLYTHGQEFKIRN